MNYWEGRALTKMDSYQREAAQTSVIVNRAYKQAMENIKKRVDSIYANFSKKAGMTPAEAKLWLKTNVSQKELQEIKDLLSTVEDIEFRKQLEARLHYKANVARLTREQALADSINIELAKVADIENKRTKSLYTKIIDKSYYQKAFEFQKGIGLGFSFASMNKGIVETILKNPWSGKNFSSRIWDNTGDVAELVTKIVTGGMISGTSTQKMAAQLNEATQRGMYNATRLIRTETTYVANASEVESYKTIGIDKYIFLAKLDNRTSRLCRDMDNKIVEVSKAVAGENLPPLHPHCRSTTRAYIEGRERLARMAKDPRTNKYHYIPADIDYNTWYDTFVTGNKPYPAPSDAFSPKHWESLNTN